MPVTLSIVFAACCCVAAGAMARNAWRWAEPPPLPLASERAYAASPSTCLMFGSVAVGFTPVAFVARDTRPGWAQVLVVVVLVAFVISGAAMYSTSTYRRPRFLVPPALRRPPFGEAAGGHGRGAGRRAATPTPGTPQAPETFVDRAVVALAPIGSFGLRETERGRDALRFENGVVFLEVRLGRRSRHLSVEVGRLNRSERFSLHEALAALAPTEAAVGRLQATDPAVQRRGLERIASVIVERLPGLLTGDAETFERLAAATAASRRNDTLAAQYGPTMEAGDTAWTAKDWDSARAAYSRAEPALDRVRRRRLRFLERRAGVPPRREPHARDGNA